MAKKIYVRNNDNTEWVPLATSIPNASAYATYEYVDNELGNIDLISTINTASAAAVTYLVDSAPETLNTLNELSAALNDDANFASTISTSLGNKLDISTASSTYLTQSSASTIYANPSTTPMSGFRNAIINGNFNIWQRGTSFASSTSNTYTADRWYANRSNGTSSVSRQSFSTGELSIPGYGSPEYFLRHDVTIGNDYTEIQQRIEDVRTFAGQTVTLSFWAKGTNPGDGSYSARLAQNFGTGGSPTLQTSFNPITVTSSWARYSATVTLPSIVGKTIGAESLLQLVIGQSNSTSTAAWTLDIWGVQLEVGTVATPFEHRPIGTELALCQRYYIRYSNGAALQPLGTCSYYTTTSTSTHVIFPVEMREKPVGGESAASAIIVYSAGTSRTSTGIADSQMSTKASEINITTSAATAGNAGVSFVRANNWIDFNAEL
jgi:hypothetical protein